MSQRGPRKLSYETGGDDSPPPKHPGGGTSPGTRQSIASLHDENVALLQELRAERGDAVKQRSELATMLVDEQRRASQQRDTLAAMIDDEQKRANAQRTDLARMLSEEQQRAQTQRDHIRQQGALTDAKVDQVLALLTTLGSQANPIMVNSQSQNAQSVSSTLSATPHFSVASVVGTGTGRSSLARTAPVTNSMEEEEKRLCFASHRAPTGVYDFLPPSTVAVAAELPTYTWPKKSPANTRLTQAFIELAAEYVKAKKDTASYLTELPSRLKALNKILGESEAAFLQTAAALVTEGANTPTLTAAIAEIGILTTTSYETLRLLRCARAGRVAIDASEFDAWAAGKNTVTGGAFIEGLAFKLRPSN